MPLYEYECGGCGKHFDLIQKFSDPVTATCAACGGTAQRLLSAPAIQFKGSGWYVTDYARKPEAGKPESGKPEAGKPDPGKPADKAEGKAEGESAKKDEAKPAAPASKDSTGKTPP